MIFIFKLKQLFEFFCNSLYAYFIKLSVKLSLFFKIKRFEDSSLSGEYDTCTKLPFLVNKMFS